MHTVGFRGILIKTFVMLLSVNKASVSKGQVFKKRAGFYDESFEHTTFLDALASLRPSLTGQTRRIQGALPENPLIFFRICQILIL